MAKHQNDPQRRKQARYAKKAMKKRRQRRTMLTVAAVLLLIGLAAAVFLTDSREPDQGTEPSVQQTAPHTGADETAPVQPQTGTTVISVAVAGDLNVTDYVVENAAHENGYDFSNAFLDVAPLFSKADLALLNFEGNLGGGTYGTQTGAAPLELPKALKDIGVDVVQTANSAAIRQGVSGLVTTLENMDQVGLTALGTYASSDSFRRSGGYEILEVEGIRIGLVAFTKGMDNLGLPAGSEDCVNILYDGEAHCRPRDR